MSAHRICVTQEVPVEVRRAFRDSVSSQPDDARLFQEIAARAVLDAIGLTGEFDPQDHDRAMFKARTWIKFGQTAEEFFDYAGINYKLVRQHVLAIPVKYLTDVPEATKNKQLKLPTKAANNRGQK